MKRAMTSTSSNSNGKKVKHGDSSPPPQCPYAVAISEDEASHSTSADRPNSPPFSQYAAVTAKCPAFSGTNQCPFKEAKSPEEMKLTLAQIPKSHYTQQDSSFVQVMQHLHQVHATKKQKGELPDAFELPTNGQCPMQSYVKDVVPDEKRKSFAQAMEDCSLAAIMARLAEDVMGDDDSTEGSRDEVEEAIMVDQQKKTAAKSQEATTISTTTQQDEAPVKRNSLAEALKTGTAVSHQAAEDVHFVRNFIKGIIPRDLYEQLILSLYHVYVALEEALDQHAPKHFPSCHFPKALARKEALEDDMEFWHNTRTPSARTISPATQDYIDRIQYLAHHEPLLLLAHSYTRYLGDLSGGRVLARVARRALDLDKSSGEGLAFYRFENVSSYKQFKDDYRKSLDDLPLTQKQIKALVAEANVAFCFNMRLFQELDVLATIPGAKVMTLPEVMEYAHVDSTVASNAKDQCPFLVNKKKEEGQQQHVATAKGRCPWPFIFAHDPWQGMKDWQTGFVVALVIAWFMRRF